MRNGLSLNNLLSIIICYAPYHASIVHEAIASANAQTLPCEVIVIDDSAGKGAGHARNRGLERAASNYVTFLDADDIIDPHFAEICLGVLSQYADIHDDVYNRYVYTDWHGVGNVVHKAPEKCQVWTEGTSHLVTTVIPTIAARRIGGFDEVMTGVEDADFYVRLRLSGLCGIHVNAPLVHYREGGQRSITARASGEESRAKQYMTNRYGGYSLMGCCGDSTPTPLTPENEPLAGDVLAQAQWQGNARRLGLATSRLYPRTSYPNILYMAPQDIAAAPHHWKAITEPLQASSGVILQPQYATQSSTTDWRDTANAIFGGGPIPQAPSKPIEYNPNTAGLKKADVLAKAKGK